MYSSINFRSTFHLTGIIVLCAGLTSAVSCGKEEAKLKEEPVRKAGPKPGTAAPAANAPVPKADELLQKAKALFTGPLPERVDSKDNPITEAKVTLGRILYYETRLSKNHELSCNSCHDLASYGIDVRDPKGKRAVSAGHKGQRGDRNSPTVYNAALQFGQFWDWREPDVEAQAKGPVLNPIEMAMPDEKTVIATLKSIPGYADLFKAAFPGEKDPITYDNMAKAIGAFERGLMTPAPFDAFLAGKTDALKPAALRGLALFVEVGCTTCHLGPGIGGTMFQKLGLYKPYTTKDTGRHRVTEKDTDKFMFKVPILRNVEKTGPYMHDGSIESLDEMVRIMGEHQTQRGLLKPGEVGDLVAFLKSLTGELPKQYSAQPELPKSGPKTPKPDPT